MGTRMALIDVLDAKGATASFSPPPTSAAAALSTASRCAAALICGGVARHEREERSEAELHSTLSYGQAAASPPHQPAMAQMLRV